MSSSSDDDDSFPNTSIAPWIQSSVSQIPGYVTRAPDDPDNVMQQYDLGLGKGQPSLHNDHGESSAWTMQGIGVLILAVVSAIVVIVLGVCVCKQCIIRRRQAASGGSGLRDYLNILPKRRSQNTSIPQSSRPWPRCGLTAATSQTPVFENDPDDPDVDEAVSLPGSMRKRQSRLTGQQKRRLDRERDRKAAQQHRDEDGAAAAAAPRKSPNHTGDVVGRGRRRHQACHNAISPSPVSAPRLDVESKSGFWGLSPGSTRPYNAHDRLSGPEADNYSFGNNSEQINDEGNAFDSIDKMMARNAEAEELSEEMVIVHQNGSRVLFRVTPKPACFYIPSDITGKRSSEDTLGESDDGQEIQQVS